MPTSRLLFLLLLVVLVCACAPERLPVRPTVSIPAVGAVVVATKDADDYSSFVRQIRINDFSLERYHDHACSDDDLAGCAHVTRIHPYLLRSGHNRVSLDYWASTLDNDPDRMFKMAFQLRESTRVDADKDKLGGELLRLETPAFPRIDEDHKRTIIGTFEWTHPMPAWSWTHGIKIEPTDDNRKSLYAAYKRIWTALHDRASLDKLEAELRASTGEYLEASRAAHQTDGLERMIALARQPRYHDVPLGLREMPDIDTLTSSQVPTFDGMTMLVFADGHLAKLVNYYATMIRFGGGAHDAPHGKPGPIDIAYDLWFRKNAKNQWEVDAVTPANDMNW